MRPGRRIAACVLLLALPTAAAETASPCDPAVWVGTPSDEDGIFEATASIECRVSSSFSLKILEDRFKAALERDRQQHSPPAAQGAAITYDVSHRFQDDGDSIWLRESVELSTTEGQLRYHARSREIEATGLSSQLRELEFDAAIGAGKARFENRVRIARPWFAPAFIFYPIARSKTLGKLEAKALELTKRIDAAEGSPLP